jgi:hypothetical protein
MTSTAPNPRTITLTKTLFVPAPLAHVRSLLSRSDAINRWEPWIAEVRERNGQWEGVTRITTPGGVPIDVPEGRRRQLIERYDVEERLGWRISYPDEEEARARLISFATTPAKDGTRLQISVGREVRSALPQGFGGALSWGIAKILYSVEARHIVKGVRNLFR